MLNRRRILVSGFAVILLPSTAISETFEDAIIAELKALGFTKFRASRTFLGRKRIVASSPKYRREIVLNPKTGEILRDYTEAIRADGGSDSGLFDSDDDDDHDDDDEDDDDDHDDS